MDEDKRLRPRIKTDFQLTVKQEETFHWTSLRNLSGGGVFIQTDTPQAVGSTVTMRLSLPVDGEAMDIQGRVIWVRPASDSACAGMGIKFTSIAPEHQEKISSFVGDIITQLSKTA